ncbi:hypothetical protein D3C81_1433000 [compost metagenome]
MAGIPVFIIVVLLSTHAFMGHDLVHRSAFGDDHVHLDGSAMVGGNRIRCLPCACWNPGEFPLPVSLPEDCPQGACRAWRRAQAARGTAEGRWCQLYRSGDRLGCNGLTEHPYQSGGSFDAEGDPHALFSASASEPARPGSRICGEGGVRGGAACDRDDGVAGGCCSGRQRLHCRATSDATG